MLESLIQYLNMDEDDQTRAVLKRLIEVGKKKIDSYAGCEIDYESDLDAQQLLFDYCRYAKSQATEVFEKNYITEINALNQRYAVENAEVDENGDLVDDEED